MKTTKFYLALFLFFFVVCSYGQKSFQVTVEGTGNPVFLFPGFGCTGALWEDTVAELSKTHECHVFTFAGFGNVPPIDMPWLITIKNEIIDYTKEKRLNKPVLIGHSLGGTLSYGLAATEPDLFKSVIAVDALPCSAAVMIPNYDGSPIPYDNPQSAMMLQMNDAVFKGMNTQQVQFMCNNQEKQQIILDMMNASDRKTYVYGYLEMLNWDLREEIAKIQIPVTILAATLPDKSTVENTYKTQFSKLPGVKILFADHAAHFVMYDQPEWFIKNIKLSLL